MSVFKSYFAHDKEQLLNTLARFDGSITVDDVTDGANISGDYYSKHNHTAFLQILLEAICSGFVRNEQHRERLLNEICQRLSVFKVIDPTLLMHTRNPVRIEIKQRFFDFVRETLKEVVPEADMDSSAISFLENSSLSSDPDICYYKCFDELEEIGRGGFGVVFKAKDRLTSLFYAVKKILFKYKNDDCYLKVIREAKNIAALDHPNIVHYNNAWLEVAPANRDSLKKSDNGLFTSNNFGSNRFDDYDAAFATEGVSAIVVRDKSSSDSSDSSGTMESHASPNSSDQNSEDSSDSVIFSYSAQEYSQNVKWPVESDSQMTSEDTVDEASSEKNSSIDQSMNLNESFKLNLNVRAMLYIQMEFCDCDLRFWLDERAKGNTLPFEMDVMEIFTNILKGVAHIHSKCIIHRDLKPPNIFYSKASNCLKIGDFGLATLANCSSSSPSKGRHVLSHHSANIGTRPYAAPEQIESKSYDSKVDIYSLGIILIELINTFSTSMEFARGITDIKNGSVTEEMRKLPKLASLLPNLVSNDPQDRTAAKDILSDFEEDTKVKLEEAEKALQEKSLQIRKMNERLFKMEANLHKKNEEIKRLNIKIKKLQAAVAVTK